MDNVLIGKRLVELRGEKTQDEVAKAVGISTSALSMYECGERIPRDAIKISLARYFKKSVQSIFFDPQ
ncbi:MAG: helix-turn-helix domain-containing protein [Lachnospiraceae bacterium]|nr:helix-turn-helix domain-containing protein [Lachnospiraceae bacterium]